MTSSHHHAAGARPVDDLGQRLAAEYDGLLPPGRVLGLVYRTARMVAGSTKVPPQARLTTCEAVARRMLEDLVPGAQRKRAGRARHRRTATRA